jgi:hypothetical protein
MAEPVTIAVEGVTDAAVVKRLLQDSGLPLAHEYIKCGKDALDDRLGGFNNAARFSCWLVLRDLDHDAPCAPELRRVLLPTSSDRMYFNIAVRAVESWLLADSDSLSRFLSVARSRIPVNPEAEVDPKRAMVDLGRWSRRRSVQEALVPASGTTAKVGPGYSALLIEFATLHWRPDKAGAKSKSLARLRDFLLSVAEGTIERC